MERWVHFKILIHFLTPQWKARTWIPRYVNTTPLTGKLDSFSSIPSGNKNLIRVMLTLHLWHTTKVNLSITTKVTTDPQKSERRLAPARLLHSHLVVCSFCQKKTTTSKLPCVKLTLHLWHSNQNPLIASPSRRTITCSGYLAMRDSSPKLPSES